MAPTQKVEKRPQKSSSNGSTTTVTVPPGQGAGLWKLFPVLMVVVGIVVGILWEQPAADGEIGESMVGSSQEDGEARHWRAGSALFFCASHSEVWSVFEDVPL